MANKLSDRIKQQKELEQSNPQLARENNIRKMKKDIIAALTKEVEIILDGQTFEKSDALCVDIEFNLDNFSITNVSATLREKFTELFDEEEEISIDKDDPHYKMIQDLLRHANKQIEEDKEYWNGKEKVDYEYDSFLNEYQPTDSSKYTRWNTAKIKEFLEEEEETPKPVEKLDMGFINNLRSKLKGM